MSEELKPCPFCGKSDFTEEFYDKELVVCNPCDIGGDRANWQNRPIEDTLRAENDRLRNELSGKTGELEKCKNGIAFYIEAGKVLSGEITSWKENIAEVRTKFLESQRVVGELTAEVVRLKAALEKIVAKGNVASNVDSSWDIARAALAESEPK